MYIVTDWAAHGPHDIRPWGDPVGTYETLAKAHAEAKPRRLYIFDDATGRWYDENAHPIATREEIMAVRREIHDGDTLLVARWSRHGRYLMPLTVSNARKTTTCFRYDLTDGYGHIERDVRDIYLVSMRIETAVALAEHPDLPPFDANIKEGT